MLGKEKEVLRLVLEKVLWLEKIAASASALQEYISADPKLNAIPHSDDTFDALLCDLESALENAGYKSDLPPRNVQSLFEKERRK